MLATTPTVRVFTAGDHFGADEKHQDSKEFIEALLNRAGYTKGFEWECRVDKLKHCSSESRPIRIIGFKNYGVVLRVKPQVHSTVDYQMTLYIPQGSGYSAKNLFEQLQANEKSISRVLRQQEREEKTKKEETMEAVVNHTPPPAPLPFKKPEPEPTVVHTEFRPDFKTLQAVLKNIDKLRYVLQKVKVVNDYNFCRNKVQFTETLRHECKWDKEGHSKGAVGRVLTELSKSDYLMETINDKDKLIGYTLTEKGIAFIARHKDDPPLPAAPPAPKKEEPKIDIPTLLIGMKEKLQELADVANKIAANNAEKAEHFRKIESLDRENHELSKIMEQNKECQDVLNRLGSLITPLPMQGVRHSSENSTLQE